MADAQSKVEPQPVASATPPAIAPTRTGGQPPPTPLPQVARPPKAPALLHLFVALCLRPEQWAQAARYPFRVTLWPLLLAIVLAALLTGIAAGRKVRPWVRAFAQTYDQQFAPMLLANGKLTLQTVPGTPTGSPAKLPPRLVIQDVPIVFDPSGKTSVDMVGTERAVLVTSTQVIFRSASSTMNLELRDLWPTTESVTISSAGLAAFLDSNGPALAITLGTTMGLLNLLINLSWAAAMIFLAAPLVTLGSAQLGMPRRVAYRVVAAAIVPLVVVSGVLDVAGYSPAQAIGAEFTPIFWFASVAALAVWSGLMASKMYRRVPAPRRG